MRLLVAGGGTGGHLFPGIAVADEVIRRGGSEVLDVLFVGTSRGIEARAVGPTRSAVTGTSRQASTSSFSSAAIASTALTTARRAAASAGRKAIPMA